jgi:hypothetical protein
MKKLPVEAQLSTLNGILVKDFDGDGKRYTASEINLMPKWNTPADASVGLFLRTADGGFISTNPAESGFFTPYNVKDIKMIKTKAGVAILVSSNNDSLRVFENKK